VANYYIKKVANDDVDLFLQCSVTNNTLTVQGLSLYHDESCEDPYSSPPTIAAGDAFHTSQGVCSIHLEPTSSDGWTFRAFKKGSSDLENPLDVSGDASTPASFSVVATSSSSTLVLDPIIRFNNNVMQQAGVPTAVMLASAYLDPPLAGAHGISVVLPIGFSEWRGFLTFDPNSHPLDEWGDPVGPSPGTRSWHAVEAVVNVATDDEGGRSLDRLDCKSLPDAEVFLVRDDPADRWTLIYAPTTGGRFVVPLFRQ
jgi:hypothetical protein